MDNKSFSLDSERNEPLPPADGVNTNNNLMNGDVTVPVGDAKVLLGDATVQLGHSKWPAPRDSSPLGVGVNDFNMGDKDQDSKDVRVNMESAHTSRLSSVQETPGTYKFGNNDFICK